MTRLLLAVLLAAMVAHAAPAAQGAVQSLHVQGNVWMFHSSTVNAAVQIGSDGVLVVDTMGEDLADAMLAEIRRLAPGKPIRIIVNTHLHSDHTGGNAKVSAAGSTIIGGNAVAELGQAAANRAQIYAHENVQTRMAQPPAGQPPVPTALWPTDTFLEAQHDLYFNGEGIELLHQPDAHTDGDTIVYFRKSDVLVTGDVYNNEFFPMVDVDNGGNLTGIITALNTIIRITIPRERQEGGTYVIPGHGRLADEADIVEYRDMTTILRDRIADAVKRGQSLEQIKAARLTRDYAGRYGTDRSFWSTDHFVETAYRSVTAGLYEFSREKRPMIRRSAHAGALMTSLVLAAAQLLAQAGRAGGPAPQGAPPTAQASAPVDLTGYWVSIVNEDWRWRMVTPPKGDFPGLPLNPDGTRAANAWDPATDGSCLAYGAAGVMRIPGRLHVTWENDNTLRVETDAGVQTRRLVFGPAVPTGGPSLQGTSRAEWERAGRGRGGRGAPGGGAVGPGAGSAGGDLKVVTTNLSGGWIRKNGVPYSNQATLTEFFDRFAAPNGDEWLVVTSILNDSRYYTGDVITSTHFRRERDGSKWDPTPCRAS